MRIARVAVFKEPVMSEDSISYDWQKAKLFRIFRLWSPRMFAAMLPTVITHDSVQDYIDAAVDTMEKNGVNPEGFDEEVKSDWDTLRQGRESVSWTEYFVQMSALLSGNIVPLEVFRQMADKTAKQFYARYADRKTGLLTKDGYFALRLVDSVDDGDWETWEEDWISMFGDVEAVDLQTVQDEHWEFLMSVQHHPLYGPALEWVAELEAF